MKTNINYLYDLFLKYPRISTDSRKIQKNSLFFSLKGENFNGNKFAIKALENGAAYAIIDEEAFKINDKCILVDDVLISLQELAKYHRSKFKIPVICITGTNGKTTTKELINSVLSAKYTTLANVGNLNNHIGVPVTLLSLKKDTEIAVIEMGANHIGEIAILCNIAQPNFGIITNIGKAHLEGFGSIEGIIKTKNELYNYLKKNGGSVFINKDDSLLCEMSGDISTISYGKDLSADYSAELVSALPFVELTYRVKKNNFTVQSQLLGVYNFENILAAICVGNHFNVEPDKIKFAIESYQPRMNRSQLVKTSKNIIVLDAYNANPSSLETAILSFKPMDFDNKIAIIGDMLELGSESIIEHKKIIDLLKNQEFTDVLLVGDIFYTLAEKGNFTYFQNTGLVYEWLKNNPITNATILIKGSRKIMLEKLVEIL